MNSALPGPLEWIRTVILGTPISGLAQVAHGSQLVTPVCQEI